MHPEFDFYLHTSLSEGGMLKCLCGRSKAVPVVLCRFVIPLIASYNMRDLKESKGVGFAVFKVQSFAYQTANMFWRNLPKFTRPASIL
jgi:hypothetical protein